jgi:transcriptional regulator with XRE-family HTH domain
VDIRKVFAWNLRPLRHERWLSQEALAQDAEVERTYISAIERGVYSASLDMLGKLATVLGVDPADMLKKPPKQSRRRYQNP